MKTLKSTIVLLLLSTICFAQNSVKEEDKIKELITKAVTATHQDYDIELTKKLYHEGFEILVLRENHLFPFSRFNWIVDLKEQKKQEKKITLDFKYIDVTGTAAIAKFLYFEDGKLSCTDYMSLYKFKEGWRIVNQTTYHHGD